MKFLSKFLPIVTCMLVPLFAFSTAAGSWADHPDCCVDECTDDPAVDVLEIGPDCLEPENQLICVKPGELFKLQLCQRNLDQLVRGYQVFLCFDREVLEVDEDLSYLTEHPYAKEIREEWDPDDIGEINLAKGIDDDFQFPTQEDALLGEIYFWAIEPACPKNDDGTIGTLVCMRDNLPPTRFGDEHGYPVYPCVRFTRVRVDETDPVINPEASDQRVECDPAVNQQQYQEWLDNLGGAGAKDDCTPEDELEWSYEVVDYVEGCCETWYANVKFIVTDCSGNSDDTTARFTVEDTTPPVIDPDPNNSTIECDPDTNWDDFQEWLDNHGGAGATDICCDPNELTWSWEYEITDGCCETWYADVVFTVTDDCNNPAWATARFTVEDTTKPVITHEAEDETAECDDTGFHAWLDNHGYAEATDVCCDPNELTWTYYPDPPEWVDGCCDTGYADVTFRVTDDCGNWKDTRTARFTSVDTTPPEITVPAEDMTVECDPNDNPGQFQAWLDSYGGAEATDVCCDPNELTWSDEYEWVDECCETGYAIVTFTVTDDCLNWATTTATFTIVDTTPPDFVDDCPLPTVSVFPNAGECDAYVCLPVPEATDICCDPNDVTVEGMRWDGLALDDPYPPGSTTVYWFATDDCANCTVCEQVVEVEAENLLVADVQLQGDFANSPCRCINFELWNCDVSDEEPVYTHQQLMAFVPNLPEHYAGGTAELHVPCALYTCMTAQDVLHTLRSTAELTIVEYTDEFTCPGKVRTKYKAEYAGARNPDNPDEIGHWLLGGNFDFCLWPDDCDWPDCDYWVDILDFAVYSSQYLQPVSCVTTCPACDVFWDHDPPGHADANADCRVDTIDFSFIYINFWLAYEPNCCGAPGAAGRGPIMRISVAELVERGWGDLAAGDLNHDGWLDVDDMEAFMNGARPKPPVKPSDPSGGSTEAEGVGPVLP